MLPQTPDRIASSGEAVFAIDRGDRIVVWNRACAALLGVIREGVRGTAMPSWRSLSEEQTWELVAFIRAWGSSGGWFA